MSVNTCNNFYLKISKHFRVVALDWHCSICSIISGAITFTPEILYLGKSKENTGLMVNKCTPDFIKLFKIVFEFYLRTDLRTKAKIVQCALFLDHYSVMKGTLHRQSGFPFCFVESTTMKWHNPVLDVSHLPKKEIKGIR